MRFYIRHYDIEFDDEQQIIQLKNIIGRADKIISSPTPNAQKLANQLKEIFLLENIYTDKNLDYCYDNIPEFEYNVYTHYDDNLIYDQSMENILYITNVTFIKKMMKFMGYMVKINLKPLTCAIFHQELLEIVNDENIYFFNHRRLI